MDRAQSSVFFRALHNLESVDADASTLYIEGYDYVMDIVKDAIFDDEDVQDMYGLYDFIEQGASYADDFSGDYGKGYQDAINICMSAVSQLIESTEV